MKLLMFIMAVLFTVPAQALTIPAGHVLERDADGIQQVVHGSESALGVKGLTEDGFYIGGNQLHMQVGDVVVSIPLYDLVYKSKEGRTETVKTHVVAEILNIPHKQLDELKREDEDVTDTAKRILVEDALVEADINIDVDEVIEAIDEGVLEQVVEEAIQESEEVIEQAIEQVEEVVEQIVEIVDEVEAEIESIIPDNVKFDAAEGVNHEDAYQDYLDGNLTDITDAWPEGFKYNVYQIQDGGGKIYVPKEDN